MEGESFENSQLLHVNYSSSQIAYQVLKLGLNISQILQIRWLLDPMHIEVNVAKNLVKHIYGKNDTRGVREDAEHVGVVKSCWITDSGENHLDLGFCPRRF